jgi:cytochrome d ubiquinol oxidase subunit II
MRGVAFEYRGKGHTIGADETKWKARFDWMIVIGSALPSLLWGVAFANIVEGVPLNKDHVFTGNLFTLLNPYGLLGGLVTLTLFFTHGLVFITLKTDGDIKDRARALATRVGIVATMLAATFLVWTLIAHFSVIGFILTALAALSLIAALFANHLKREGISFSLLVFTIITAVGSLFAALFPNVFPSSTNPAFSLTIDNASSSQYTLTVMTWVAVIMIPLVLLYQGWTYWVFRKRVSRNSIPAGSH